MKYESTIIILQQQKGLYGYILSCPFVYITACVYSDNLNEVSL